MLKELRISNFRLFDDEVKIRFRPITVFIGRNNAGKSSVIKFLLMLQQSLNSGNSEFMTAQGDKVQLGLFSELKNSLTKKRALKFYLSTEISSPGYGLNEYVGFLNNDKSKDERIDSTNINYSVETTVSYSEDGQTGKGANSKFEVTSDGKSIISQEKAIAEDSVFLDFASDAWRDMGSLYIPETKADNSSDISTKNNEQIKMLQGMNVRLQKITAQIESYDVLRYQINSIRHLAPVREESQRVIIAAPPPKGDVGQRGQYALPHLHKITTGSKKDYEFILPHIESVAGVTDIRFENLSGSAIRCIAKNTATGADVFVSDFGFGVSQSIPIFVQGAIMPAGTSLMVEQPEAHLHPTAQLEMGEFFADLWNKRKVGSIIETHSDNILLRLRRLISTNKLSADDVSVAFFDIEDNKAVVKNLNIEKDGTMEDGLSMEFFHQNIWESLEMGEGE